MHAMLKKFGKIGRDEFIYSLFIPSLKKIDAFIYPGGNDREAYY